MGSMFYADVISLRRRCEELGISVSIARLPHELRGYNSVFEDQKTIVISEYQSWPGADAHTLLHELREVMEHSFREQAYPTATAQELEKRAELFASLVMAASVQEGLPELIDSASRVSAKGLRWGAYLLITAGAFLFMAAFALVPYFEDLQESEETKRHS